MTKSSSVSLEALQPRSGAPKARGLTATSGAKLSYNQAVVAL